MSSSPEQIRVGKWDFPAEYRSLKVFLCMGWTDRSTSYVKGNLRTNAVGLVEVEAKGCCLTGARLRLCWDKAAVNR